MSPVSYVDLERKSRTAPSATVSAFFLKQVYASMLHNMELSKAREFWNSQWSCAKDTFPSKSDFYFKLWQVQTRFDFQTVVKFSKNLESFVSRQGTDIAGLIHDAFHYGRSLTESARFLLHQCAPILQNLFTAEDTRKQILYSVGHLTLKFTSGIHNILLDHTTGDDMHETRFLLSYPEEANCPDFNSELWIVLLVKYLPTLFSLDPYEDHFMVSDCRKIKEIVPQAQIVNDTLIINGEVFGRVNYFYDFCKKKSVLFKVLEHKIPDSPVIELRKDYTCPQTGRIILHKGCAYEAPTPIYGFRYKPQKGKQSHNLGAFIETATADGTALDTEVSHRHTLMIKTLKEKVDVKFFKTDESISVNGKHLVKCVPAKILRHIIASYLQSGQTDFEYKEIIKTRDIIMDYTNPNIAIRLKRLSLMLKNNFPQLSIIMNGRGRFKITVNCELEYSEE